jgi:general secretion pathway protein A
VAGLTDALPFDAPAMKRIHELTRGVPRRINLLCGRALLGAWSLGEPMASRATVDQAAKEVFGSEHIGQTNASQRRTRIALAALGLLLAGTVGALAIWSNAPKPQPPTPTSAPAH